MTSTLTGRLVQVRCGACDVAFGLTDRMYEARREDHATFYCPNGHPRAYTGPSPTERALQDAKRDAASLERQLANRDEDVRVARASLTATKGQLTKARKRAAAGVCPCCKRTFANVARHVAGQHPEHLTEVRADA